MHRFHAKFHRYKSIEIIFLLTIFLLSILAASGCGAKLRKRDILFNEGSEIMSFDQDTAITKFTAAIKIDPEFVQAYVNRGITYGYQRHWYLAIEDFNRALELEPKSAAAFYNRGYARKQSGDKTGAEEDFARCLKLDKSYKGEVNYQRKRM